jgi:hypothetical protein
MRLPVGKRGLSFFNEKVCAVRFAARKKSNIKSCSCKIYIQINLNFILFHFKNAIYTIDIFSNPVVKHEDQNNY